MSATAGMTILQIQSRRSDSINETMKRLLQCLVVWVFFSLCTTGCQPADHSLLEQMGARYEARAWLRSNPILYAFAGNRFDSTAEALVFVGRLYDAGALEVWVTNIYDEAWRIEAEGGPYADTLIVRLPEDQGARQSLFEIANREAQLEGFAPDVDQGQDLLLLWWD